MAPLPPLPSGSESVEIPLSSATGQTFLASLLLGSKSFPSLLYDTLFVLPPYDPLVFVLDMFRGDSTGPLSHGMDFTRFYVSVNRYPYGLVKHLGHS
jgi:hypothetical protein